VVSGPSPVAATKQVKASIEKFEAFLFLHVLADYFYFVANFISTGCKHLAAGNLRGAGSKQERQKRGWGK